MDIVELLTSVQPCISATTFRQLCRIVLALVTMTGRVTMLGIARWTEKGGSYRTVQPNTPRLVNPPHDRLDLRLFDRQVADAVARRHVHD